MASFNFRLIEAPLFYNGNYSGFPSHVFALT